MNQKDACTCGEAPKLIFACSGAADVGEIADRAARRLSAEKAGKMFCSVGIGGRVSGIMETTGAASAILAIDGCPLDCVKASLENAGFTEFQHIRVTDMGMEKGKSPVTAERIDAVADAARKCLDA